MVADPAVVFEVFSPSNVNDDLIAGNAEYRATPSIQRYVVLQQTHAAAIVFYRKGKDWATEPLGPEDMLHLPEEGLTIPMAEFYLGVTLDAPESAPA